MIRRLHNLLVRITSWRKPSSAERPTLMGIYLNHANRPTLAAGRDATLRERQNERKVRLKSSAASSLMFYFWGHVDLLNRNCRINDATVVQVEPISLAEEFALIQEYWCPKVVAELNGQELKLVNFNGVFPWHAHEKEDEILLVWRGRMAVDLRHRDGVLQRKPPP
jgi:mannose-6-phosphate isomerase-like protein (cupin superfamily)